MSSVGLAIGLAGGERALCQVVLQARYSPVAVLALQGGELEHGALVGVEEVAQLTCGRGDFDGPAAHHDRPVVGEPRAEKAKHRGPLRSSVDEVLCGGRVDRARELGCETHAGLIFWRLSPRTN